MAREEIATINASTESAAAAIDSHTRPLVSPIRPPMIAPSPCPIDISEPFTASATGVAGPANWLSWAKLIGMTGNSDTDSRKTRNAAARYDVACRGASSS